MNAIDLTGQTFGRWTVVARGENSPWGRCRWLCRCACGLEKDVSHTNLKRGLSSSCMNCAAKGRTEKHGLSRTPEYRALVCARNRCISPSVNAYVNYGGRGIEYRLPDDLGDATRTLIAAIGTRPAGLTLDRIDNDGHYEIGNLRWAGRADQNKNKRNPSRVT